MAIAKGFNGHEHYKLLIICRLDLAPDFFLFGKQFFWIDWHVNGRKDNLTYMVLAPWSIKFTIVIIVLLLSFTELTGGC